MKGTVGGDHQPVSPQLPRYRAQKVAPEVAQQALDSSCGLSAMAQLQELVRFSHGGFDLFGGRKLKRFQCLVGDKPQIALVGSQVVLEKDGFRIQHALLNLGKFQRLRLYERSVAWALLANRCPGGVELLECIADPKSCRFSGAVVGGFILHLLDILIEESLKASFSRQEFGSGVAANLRTGFTQEVEQRPGSRSLTYHEGFGGIPRRIIDAM